MIYLLPLLLKSVGGASARLEHFVLKSLKDFVSPKQMKIKIGLEGICDSLCAHMLWATALPGNLELKIGMYMFFLL